MTQFEKPARRGLPMRYLLAITFITILYLVVELGFNARLLDVTGSLASKDEVTAIERWGRLISGFAVALFVWGSFIFPRAARQGWSAAKFGMTLLLSASLLITATYLGEKALVDSLVDHSSPAARASAAELRLVSNAVLTGKASLIGVDLSRSAMNAPEGKTFLALLPFIANSTQGLQGKLAGSLHAIAVADTVDRLGGREHLYDSVYRDSIAHLRDAYNRYVDGQRVAGPAATLRAQDAPSLWQRYLAKLEDTMHATPDQVPTYAWHRVAREVQAMGVPVSKNWNPQDYRSFATAVDSLGAQRASTSMAAMRTVNQTNLPADLSWNDFLRQPSIQQSWKRSLTCNHEDFISASLVATMSVAEFDKVVYEPLVDGLARRQLEPFRLSRQTFGDGGSSSELGRSAVQWLLVPPIALLFSLLGALTHLFKSIKYALSIVHRALWQDVAVGVAVILVALSAFLTSNPVSRSAVFQYFLSSTAAASSPVVALAVDWVVRAQPYAYPVNEFVRRRVLGGFTFGYLPDSAERTSCFDSAR